MAKKKWRERDIFFWWCQFPIFENTKKRLSHKKSHAIQFCFFEPKLTLVGRHKKSKKRGKYRMWGNGDLINFWTILGYMLRKSWKLWNLWRLQVVTLINVNLKINRQKSVLKAWERKNSMLEKNKFYEGKNCIKSSYSVVQSFRCKNDFVVNRT